MDRDMRRKGMWFSRHFAALSAAVVILTIVTILHQLSFKECVNDKHRPFVFLFVGVLSKGSNKHARIAIRESWGNVKATRNVIVSFILSSNDMSRDVLSEIAEHRDIVVADEYIEYKTILRKTLKVFEAATSLYRPAFVMKTDDDSFVNPFALTHILRTKHCSSPPFCMNEKLYLGYQWAHAPVRLNPQDKFANIEFTTQTGLKEYPYYNDGAGYVLSGTIVRALVDMNLCCGLKFSSMEDAMVGAWLMPIAGIVHAHIPRIHTLESFRDTETKLAAYEQTICDLSESAVIVHKASPKQIQYLSAAVHKCMFA